MGDTYARRHRSSLRRGLKGTGLNEMGALARLLDHIYSHFQPWFEDAVSEILDEPAIAALRRGKYVGFHIRRTDKIVSEARKTDTEAYFTAAAKYLDGAVVGPAVTDISGVWLSSDDESVLAERGAWMWKPGEVVESSRRRAVTVWTVSVLAIVAYSCWLLYKAVEKTKTPDTSFVLTNEVYKYPDLWICLYNKYGCDQWEFEANCVDSAWDTEGGVPYAAFYPRDKLEDYNPNLKFDERRIDATPELTNEDDEGKEKNGRGHCVVFETSAATDFVGQERNPEEYLDYIHIDMYWYPSGKFRNSTTCVAEGEEWTDHREWVYAFLSDPEDDNMISTGIQLSYSCITNTSNTHIFNTVGIGLTNEKKYTGDETASYKALFTNFGVHKNAVNPNITTPYARVSLEMKQEANSWNIITEANPFEFAEMFGNIGGFWDLLLILWPLCFVAASQQEPHLKPRTFKKSVVRGAERAAGITKVVARSAPRRRTSSLDSGVDGFHQAEELPHWERNQQPAPPAAASVRAKYFS
eukprot:g11506.t1